MTLSAYECNFDAITRINLAVKPSRYDMSYFQKKIFNQARSLTRFICMGTYISTFKASYFV